LETKNVFVVSSEQTSEVACAITEVMACGNLNATLKCDDRSACDKANETIKRHLDDNVAKGELKAEQVETALNRIQITTDLDAAKNAEVAIESVFEDESLKRKTLSELDSICSPGTIFATNSSTITVTNLANATSRPQQIVGMHFIYFSPVMKVVELARGLQTSDATFSAIEKLSNDVGLESVISEDVSGLLSTRIWMIHLNEAANNVFNKLVEPEALKKLNRTISPNALSILESADFIGLDNCVALLQNLYCVYGDPRYTPSPALIQMVDAGHLGLRTGRGFFNYN
jgi:3-hydroxybutyryl-CoA dehydrogenase